MKKRKIYDKIECLEMDMVQLEKEIRVVLTDPLYRDYPRVQSLAERINIILNERSLLEELVN